MSSGWHIVNHKSRVVQAAVSPLVRSPAPRVSSFSCLGVLSVPSATRPPRSGAWRSYTSGPLSFCGGGEWSRCDVVNLRRGARSPFSRQGGRGGHVTTKCLGIMHTAVRLFIQPNEPGRGMSLWAAGRDYSFSRPAPRPYYSRLFSGGGAHSTGRTALALSPYGAVCVHPTPAVCNHSMSRG